LETFADLKDFVDNPRFHDRRRESLVGLDLSTIDLPIAGLIRDLAGLPCCFTLQSCYGHFLYPGQTDSHNLEPLPRSGGITVVEYRIAYLALCIEDSGEGRRLFEALRRVPQIDPEYVQFGCAGWFWERQMNSYALQVEPDRHKNEDACSVSYREALHIEKVRDEFFAGLGRLVRGL